MPVTNSAACVIEILRDYWPAFPYVYFGASGTMLIHRALLAHSCRLAVLPAFFCPKISAAVTCAGKRLIHIDADRRTLLPNYRALESVLASQDSVETVLLIDHSFGYPFTYLERLRRRFPKLLIIEDCARALGVRIANEYPGEHADWLLLSMYKTVPGSGHGSVLLSRTPLALGSDRPLRASIRERVANISLLRTVYQRLQRFKATAAVRSASDQFDDPGWAPLAGGPSSLSCKRFATALKDWDSAVDARQSVAQTVCEGLRASGFLAISPESNGRWPAQFLSFAARTRQERDELIPFLAKRGVSVGWSWHIIPPQFQCFSGTFPAGTSDSVYLAEHMIHVRISALLRPSRQAALIRALRAYRSAGRVQACTHSVNAAT